MQFNQNNYVIPIPNGGIITKLLRVMKLVTVLLFAFCLQATAYTEAQTISLSVKNAPLKEVLKKIQKETGVNVLFDEAVLQKSDKVTFTVKNASLEQVLEECFKNQPVEYSLIDNTIVLKQSVGHIEEEEVATLTIEGVVLDERGYPLAKVSVQNTNTKKGTSSGEDGSFRIEASEGDLLHFSYVGYKIQVLKVSTNTTKLRIKMQPTEVKLEEVVITGYQQIRNSEMTGSVSRVKAENLVINGTTTIEQVLQGKLPGLEVVNNSGLVGTSQTVRVRGTSTLLGNQEPVWVVDGIIQENPLPFKASELNHFGGEAPNSDRLKTFIGSAVSWLNAYDIDEVTVLKDAASTAIYGVKAANGVILITTKRGKTGSKPVVSYSGSVSTQNKISYDRLNLMNSLERVDVSREIWERGLTSYNTLDNIGYSGLLKDYLDKKIDYAAFNQGVKTLEENNTNWFDILFQNPVNQSHSISVSGGGSTNSYYGSFSANNQKGTAKGNGTEMYGATLNFVSYITPRLSVSTKLATNYTKTTGFFNIDPYSYASKTSRVIPAFDSNGDRSFYNYNNTGFKYNILNELDNSGNQNIKTSVNASVNLRYRLPSGFSFESLLGVGYANVLAESYASEKTYRITSRRMYEYGMYRPIDKQYRMSQLPVGGELSSLQSQNVNYTWRNSLNYGRTFSKKHSVTGMLGLEVRSNMYDGVSRTQFGYLPDRGKIIIPPAATIENAVGTMIENPLYSSGFMPTTITDNKSNFVSYYGSAAYTYDNRYTLNISVRGDASNKFGQDTRNRFRPIWAIGGRWNVAREKFFNKSSWFNDFAIRASLGLQGNVAENYGPELIARIPAGVAGINSFTGEPLLNISSLPYSNLRWEKTKTINIGLDFSFFAGRVNAMVDYYSKESKDLIIMKDVPYENGVTTMAMNGGTLTNSGFDLGLNFIPIRNKKFLWTFGITSSRNINKITNRQMQNPTWVTAASGNYYQNGYAVSSFWVFDFKGLDSATGIPLYNIPTTAQNPDGKQDATAFMQYAGKLNPDFTGGISTSVRYKMFTVSANMYLSIGAKKLMAPLYSPDITRTTPNEYNNLSKILVDRWRKPGDHLKTDVPSLPSTSVTNVTIPSGAITLGSLMQTASESPYVLYNFSDIRVVNASYLRISTVSLNYTVTEKVAKKLYAKTANIGYNVGNLYTFVSKDFKGLDPEVASGSQPIPVTHTITLSVSF